jgi:hypothetical protein
MSNINSNILKYYPYSLNRYTPYDRHPDYSGLERTLTKMARGGRFREIQGTDIIYNQRNALVWNTMEIQTDLDDIISTDYPTRSNTR